MMSVPDSPKNPDRPTPPMESNEEIYLKALHAMLWDPKPFTPEELDDLRTNGVDFGETVAELIRYEEEIRASSGK